MHDMRWPAWDQGTYYCFWYMKVFPQHLRGGTFYGGVATHGPESPPGMFMSYWGRLTNIHEGEFFYRHGYGGEGSSGGAHGKAVFLRPGAWYRFVMRVFPPTKDSDKETYVGWCGGSRMSKRTSGIPTVLSAGPFHSPDFRGTPAS